MTPLSKASQHLRKKQIDVSLTLAKRLMLNNVLSLLAAGSSGKTLEQLLTFLKAKSIDDLNTVYAHLVDAVFADASSSGGPVVFVANGVWLDESLTFNPSYQHAGFSSCRFQEQGQAEEVRNIVNLWVEKETGDLIKEILPPHSVQRSAKLILANALWVASFSRESRVTTRISCYSPRERVKVGELRIPKFKFEYAIEASKALESLGLVFPFDPCVGLSEMVSDPMPLFVSYIFHKSFIEIDEQGTEVAAATVGSYGLGCGRRYLNEIKTVDFVADHPFLFVIRENTTGIVQFMGHVLNPSIT
ncbi:serpin-ZX-like [Apium graveolens]|uniref:serpin-ZX-like n=1 Tax=Apium graveolens TaxID=4045 RepID=UPI003D7A5A80